MRHAGAERIATHSRVPPEVHAAVATTAGTTTPLSCADSPPIIACRRMMRREHPAHRGQTPAEAGWLLRCHALAPREPTPAHLVEAARIEAHRPHLPRRGETLAHSPRGCREWSAARGTVAMSPIEREGRGDRRYWNRRINS